MNTDPDPRTIAKWLWSRYLSAWFLVFVPVSLAGVLAGVVTKMPVDVANLGYIALISVIVVLFLISLFVIVETLLERYLRWKRWQEFIHAEQPALAAKQFARDVTLDYQIAHQPAIDPQDA